MLNNGDALTKAIARERIAVATVPGSAMFRDTLAALATGGVA